MDSAESELSAAVIRRSALVSGCYINEERKKNRRNKIIDLGIKEWKRERALELLRSGNVTIMKAASLAGVSIYEMLKLVKERDIAWVAFDEDDFK